MTTQGKTFTARPHNPYAARAISAYFKYEDDGSGQLMQPRSNPELWADEEGKQYVVLSNVRGILAVYRVRNDGVLKGLKRWPRELDEKYGGAEE